MVGATSTVSTASEDRTVTQGPMTSTLYAPDCDSATPRITRAALVSPASGAPSKNHWYVRSCPVRGDRQRHVARLADRLGGGLGVDDRPVVDRQHSGVRVHGSTRVRDAQYVAALVGVARRLDRVLLVDGTGDRRAVEKPPVGVGRRSLNERARNVVPSPSQRILSSGWAITTGQTAVHTPTPARAVGVTVRHLRPVERRCVDRQLVQSAHESCRCAFAPAQRQVGGRGCESSAEGLDDRRDLGSVDVESSRRRGVIPDADDLVPTAVSNRRHRRSDDVDRPPRRRAGRTSGRPAT